MYKALWFFFSLFPFFSYAQELQSKQSYYGRGKKLKEVYSVLKSHPETRHGAFESYYPNQRLRQKGFFKKGSKHGEWVLYKESGQLKAVQHYQEGKKVGVWKTYREGGKVVEQYDYDQDKALESIIRVSVYYPPLAREYEVEGVVKVKILFDGECQPTTIQALTNLGYDCEEEAVKAVKRMIALSKKYKTPLHICGERSKIISFDFKLE